MKQFLWIVPPLFALDRLVKLWALRVLKPLGRMDIAPGLFGLRYAENTGAALSIFEDHTGVLTLLTALLMLGIVLYICFAKQPARGIRPALWVIFSGGLGNLFDRIVYGFVIDLFEFQFVRFAIFNVADICICLGALAFFVIMLREILRENRRTGESSR